MINVNEKNLKWMNSFESNVDLVDYLRKFAYNEFKKHPEVDQKVVEEFLVSDWWAAGYVATDKIESVIIRVGRSANIIKMNVDSNTFKISFQNYGYNFYTLDEFPTERLYEEK